MKHAGGRPVKRIDLVELEKLCVLQCTQEEIAAFFEVGIATIERRARQPRFREVMQRGYHKGKISVRRKQMQLLEAGSNTMAVWLGKQLLGQRDKSDVNVGGGGSPIDVNYSATEDLIGVLASISAKRNPTTGS